MVTSDWVSLACPPKGCYFGVFSLTLRCMLTPSIRTDSKCEGQGKEDEASSLAELVVLMVCSPNWCTRSTDENKKWR